MKRPKGPVMGRDDATGAIVPLPTAGYRAVWAVYENPRDWPGKFVVREYRSKGGRTVAALSCFVCDTLGQARECLPRGLKNIGRQPGDDPVIREVWA